MQVESIHVDAIFSRFTGIVVLNRELYANQNTCSGMLARLHSLPFISVPAQMFFIIGFKR